MGDSTYTLHASRVPLFLRCSQSVRGESSIGESSVDAALGRAVHAALADHVSGRTNPDAEWMAASRAVDADELRDLIGRGERLWERVADGFPLVIAEAPLSCVVAEDLVLCGRPDVFSFRPAERRVAILDWKSGWGEGVDHWQQLAAYALICSDGTQAADSGAVLMVAWLRRFSVEQQELDHDALEEFRRRLIRQWGRDSYEVGDHCTFCPRRIECPARRSWVEHAIETISSGMPTGATTIEALAAHGRLADLLGACGAIERAADAARKAIREYVAAEGGSLRQGETVLALVEQERREILAREAWEILSRELGSDIGDCIEVRKSAVEEALKRGADRGQKGARVARVMAELAAAGAVRVSKFTKLMSKKGE